MRGKIVTWDDRTGQGHILFADHLIFPFNSGVVMQPVILRRGDEVTFNLRQRGPDEVVFDVRLDADLNCHRWDSWTSIFKSSNVEDLIPFPIPSVGIMAPIFLRAKVVNPHHLSN